MSNSLDILARASARRSASAGLVVPAGPPVRVAVEDEAARIRDLPWADYSDEEIRQAAVEWASARWRKPNARMQFRAIQALALLVAHLLGGAFLPIGTGWGKGLISLLICDAMGGRRPLLFIPPDMRIPLENAKTRDYAPSFRLPTNLRIMAYSQLSQASSTDALDRLAPDAIAADEAHRLRHADAARTKRVGRFLRANPNTKVAVMSGTLTSKSIEDYSHLAEWALGDKSPVPRAKFFPVLKAFCAILDSKPTKSGSNGHYQSEAAPHDWHMFSRLFPDWKDYDAEPPADEQGNLLGPSPRVERARQVFMSRLLGAPGVVGTDALSVGASLYFRRREVQTPQIILDHLLDLESTWRRPDGEELVLAIDKWRCGRQLSQGFYYRWKWPEGKPTDEDKEWLRTRAAWHREVREVCKANLPHLDSPLLVTNAARRTLAGEDGPLAHRSLLLHALEEWTPHAQRRWHGKPTPPTETIWLDSFLLDDVMRWAEEHPTGLVWYDTHALADKLAERGMRVYGAGTNPEEIQGAHGAALSLHVHKDGKNLQKHSDALFISFSPSGTEMEQAISREHRAGQEADEVNVYYYDHTEPARNAIVSARNDAAYIQGTLNTPQRLCYGTWV